MQIALLRTLQARWILAFRVRTTSTVLRAPHPNSRTLVRTEPTVGLRLPGLRYALQETTATESLIHHL
jgi:hypothetical protein